MSHSITLAMLPCLEQSQAYLDLTGRNFDPISSFFLFFFFYFLNHVLIYVYGLLHLIGKYLNYTK